MAQLTAVQSEAMNRAFDHFDQAHENGVRLVNDLAAEMNQLKAQWTGQTSDVFQQAVLRWQDIHTHIQERLTTMMTILNENRANFEAGDADNQQVLGTLSQQLAL